MTGTRMCLDTGVHDWLRIAGFVAFVMPQPAKTDEVEHHVFVKFSSVIERDLDHAKSGFRVVAVYVEYRSLRNVSRVGRINGAAAEARRCGNPDLLISYTVYRPAFS